MCGFFFKIQSKGWLGTLPFPSQKVQGNVDKLYMLSVVTPRICPVGHLNWSKFLE